MGVKIEDVPTPKLKKILSATERLMGAESASVLILRRELTRRAGTKILDRDTPEMPTAKADTGGGD